MRPEENIIKIERWSRIVIGIVVLAVVAAVAVPYVYIHFIKDDAPKELSLADVSVAPTNVTTVTTAGVTASPTTPTAASAASAPSSTTTYTLTSASQAGYRVVEVLFGQDTEGVGRTNSVTGTITLDGAQVTAATFSVDMATLKSDADNRDNKFRGEIMQTSTFPTATFTITQPIELGSIPADATAITASATGDLTLHGVKKSVTLDVTAKKTGNSVAIAGSTDVGFADYGIANPSNGAITTEDHGMVEFLLVAAS